MVKRIAIRSFKIAKFCHTGRCISRYIKSEKCFIEWTPEEPLRRCTTLPTSTLHRIALDDAETVFTTPTTLRKKDFRENTLF